MIKKSYTKFLIAIGELHAKHLVNYKNNYVQNRYTLDIFPGYIEIRSACMNEYGSIWSNEDLSRIPWGDITPNWVHAHIMEWYRKGETHKTISTPSDEDWEYLEHCTDWDGWCE